MTIYLTPSSKEAYVTPSSEEASEEATINLTPSSEKASEEATINLTPSSEVTSYFTGCLAEPESNHHAPAQDSDQPTQ